ncbi:8069_t:CDS:2, partial [Racocetra fulgida]
MASKEELRKRKTYLQIAGEDGTKSLLRCTRCRMSYYCSKSCQKADFLFHKQFCAAIEELSNLEEVWYSCNGKESEWNKRKIYHMQLLAATLDRDLTSTSETLWAPEEWDEGLIYPPLPKDWSSYLKWRKAPQFNQLDAADRKRIYSLHPISYHEYSTSDDFITPQIVVGFNIGLYDEFWKPSVEFLIEKELPCIFTSYSKDEANQDAKMLKTLGAKIIVSANENKWR